LNSLFSCLGILFSKIRLEVRTIIIVKTCGCFSISIIVNTQPRLVCKVGAGVTALTPQARKVPLAPGAPTSNAAPTASSPSKPTFHRTSHFAGEYSLRKIQRPSRFSFQFPLITHSTHRVIHFRPSGRYFSPHHRQDTPATVPSRDIAALLFSIDDC
jgi:hypothetical protein